MFVSFLITLMFGWQLQGGTRQTIQVTERARVIQPANVQVQEQPEEVTDLFQPALGYEVLSQPYSGTLEVR